MTNTLIKCLANEEGLAQDVYNYLYAELEKHANLKEGKNLQIDAQMIRLIPDSNEIEIDERAQAPSGMIKWILERHIESDPTRFKDYGIIQFEHTFTISKVMPASEMGLHSCELCSYSTLYEEELYRHRTLHAGFG